MHSKVVYRSLEAQSANRLNACVYHTGMLTRICAVAMIAAGLATGAVQSISVKEQTPLAGGMSFGEFGPYERIVATVHFAIDPNLPQNRRIVDIDLAPKNPKGLVEFSSDVLIFRPRDLTRGNGTALLDIPNRGRMLALSVFNRGPLVLDPKTSEEIGDGLLMRRGFTIVSLGWEWDEPLLPGRLGLQAPTIPGLTGLVRSEFVPDRRTARFSLADRDQIPYRVANEQDPSNRFFVRTAPGMPRKEIPHSKWRFVENGQVEYDEGCQPGLIYEVVYRATGAVPVGLGFAAVRDLAAFLKSGSLLSANGSHPVQRTLAFGLSQTGRFLRDFLYQGFNQDEKQGKALDGVWAEVAGAGRGTFNQRFGQPSRDGQPFLHSSWAVDMFPFSDVETDDPLTGRSGGLLSNKQSLATEPKIFYTNHSFEYWGRAASLIHTTPDGRKDLAPAANTRIYFLAGAQHTSGSLPLTRTDTQNLVNPLDIRWAMRALLIDFHEWLKDGVEPPASVYPRISAGELVAPAEVKYPHGIERPRWPRTPRLLDFGPELESKGIVSIEPPKEGRAYTIRVPQVDADGNELGGVRVPELEVPLGIYTGWNLRTPSIGSPDHMVAFIGSFFPFGKAAISTRYAGRQGYLARVRAAGEKLSRARLVLPPDIEPLTQRAAQLWDELMSSAPAATPKH